MSSEHHDAECEAAFSDALQDYSESLDVKRMTSVTLYDRIRDFFFLGWSAREQHDKETEAA